MAGCGCGCACVQEQERRALEQSVRTALEAERIRKQQQEAADYKAALELAKQLVRRRGGPIFFSFLLLFFASVYLGTIP